MIMAACGMLASAATAGNELLPFLAPARATGQSIIPLSSHAASTLLRDCFQAMNSARVRMLEKSERIAFDTRCRTLALDLAGRNPTMAHAWCVAAFASAEIGDRTGFESQFNECRRTAPRELWLSAMRFDMALANDALYEPALRAAVVGDMANLIGSHRGRQMVAKACAREPLLLALAAAAQQGSTAEERAAFEAALDKARGGAP
jgi:hypothetical protein